MLSGCAIRHLDVLFKSAEEGYLGLRVLVSKENEQIKMAAVQAFGS